MYGSFAVKLPDLLPYKNMDSPSRVLELEKDLADIITCVPISAAPSCFWFATMWVVLPRPQRA